MDTPEKPKRPSWKRKRWWAAAVLLLLVAYPASVGPIGYGFGRGWVPSNIALAYVAPMTALFGPSEYSPVGAAFNDYADWWYVLGRQHAASD